VSVSRDDDGEIVCVCHEVTRGAIRALAERRRSFEDLVAGTPMCRTCQGCEWEIRKILAEVSKGARA